MPKPKPFSRPSIDLTRPDRAWREVRAESIVLGDMLAELGVVMTITPGDRTVLLEGPEKSRTFERDRIVLAFVRQED